MMSEFKLSRAIDGGGRFVRHAFSVKMFSSFKRFLHWSPFLYGNAGLFYGNDEFLGEFLDRLHGNCSLEKDGRIHFFDFEADRIFIEDGPRFKNYSRNEHTLSSVVDEVFAASSEMAKACFSSGFLEPPNRELDIIVVSISPKILRGLAQQSGMKLLKALESSGQFRVPVILISRTADPMFKQVVKKLNWAGFMGETNEAFAIDFYPDLEPGFFNIGRVKNGLLYCVDREYLPVIQGIDYVPSEWRKMSKARKDAEQRVYGKFLEGLDDGTN